MTWLHRAAQAGCLIAIAWSLSMLATHWGIPDAVIALWQFVALTIGLGWIFMKEEE